MESTSHLVVLPAIVPPAMNLRFHSDLSPVSMIARNPIAWSLRTHQTSSMLTSWCAFDNDMSPSHGSSFVLS